MITVDIVTPTRKFVERANATSVTIPGARGELQILPGHADLLTLLRTGSVVIAEDGKERKFAISHGFAEVKNNRVMVLAETVEEAKDIDTNRAKSAQKKAETTLSGLLSEEEFNKHQLKLQRALVRQQIIHH